VEPLPENCLAAIYDPGKGAGGSLDVRLLPLRSLRPGEILVRVTLSAICGSDLHTVSGRRRPRGPLILGHEITGTVADLGEGISKDADGRALAVGDRVTWSIAASCGRCFYCTKGIPQKCESLFKYGHESIDADPPLNGGFAEYIYLVPGTAVHRVPEGLADEEVVFANCSLATMAAAVRVADLRAGESVLVHGAGLVGVCAAALATARGARTVMVADVDAGRLERARQFGATHVLNAAQADADAFRRAASEAAGPRGFDVAIEACGRPDVIPPGIESLRIGGRYIPAGCVYSGSATTLDVHRIITRLIRIIGLHNYAPEDLRAALAFLSGPGRAMPFKGVVGKRFKLDEIRQATEHANQRRDILRVAIEP
jgi:putative phosphonate catabolism associated alcohol dehydrogenase